MKINWFGTVIGTLLLAGCAGAPDKPSYTSEQLCVLDQPGRWSQLPGAPPPSDQLIGMADAHPVFPNRSGSPPPVISWFESDDGAMMLCRHDNTTCVGEWWIYRSDQGEWKIEKSDGWVCVT